MEDISKNDIMKFYGHARKASCISIVSHVNPDGDAVGSCTAMQQWLKKIGKNALIVLPNDIPFNLKFLAGGYGSKVLSFNRHPEAARKAVTGSDMIICLDFNDLSRVNELGDIIRESKAMKILIDHHLDPAEDQFDMVFSRTGISSASELLFWILMEMPETGRNASRLPKRAAKALLTGMTTDTNNFSNSTFPSTFRMASELIAAGVDRDDIIQKIYHSHQEGRYRLLGHILESGMKITEDGAAYFILDMETAEHYRIKDGDTEGFVNIPLGIKDVRMCIFAKEVGDHIRISIRSKKGTSANRCAKLFFNGGGHENASGGTLRIPEDLSGVGEVGTYIENALHNFFSSNEK